MSFLIDIPQLAYKTISLKYIIRDKNGNRDFERENEAEQSLKSSLKEYSYSIDHEHVK